MSRFHYKAKVSPAEIKEGAVNADNKMAAIQKISGMGYYLLSIEEEKKIHERKASDINVFKEKLSLKDVTNFTRQLSDLLDSGVSVVRSLDVLNKQVINKKLKSIIGDIKDQCIDGSPLSESLARHPKIFSDLYVSMVKSGEVGGALESILNRLADFYEKQLEIQTKVKAALAYPVLMAIVGCMTIIVLLTFVIPKMVSMFADLGQNLPLPTLILMAVNGFIQRFWWIIIACISVISFAIMRVYRSSEGRFAIDNFKLKIPIAGDVIKKVEIARFARTFATLLANGVPMMTALQGVGDTVNNAVIKGEIEKVRKSVREGGNLAGTFSKSPIIPPMVTDMVAVGEESGSVERALFKVAESYERESDAAVKVLMSLLEPLMILALGIVVGFIVISMLLPIFELNFLVR